MSYDLAKEDPNTIWFSTSKTIQSRLWFVANPELDERVRAYLAKNQENFQATLYSFIIMGNHYHLQASFPLSNRSAFLKSLNSVFAKLVAKHVPSFKGGKLWSKRPKVQAALGAEEVFFYSALNPVSSGLVTHPNLYPSYNSFEDAVSGKESTFEVVNWRDFNDRKRFNSKIKVEDFTKTYTLKFSRLPGYEHMSQREYENILRQKFEEKRISLVEKRKAEGKGFSTPQIIQKTKPGTKPRNPKQSSRHTKRPLVLTSCKIEKEKYLERYFADLYAYKKASLLYRSGKLDTAFPPWTYKPTLLTVP